MIIPEGKKIWVLGDEVESNRPATNFPRIPVDSNRFDCLVEKSGLGVEPLAQTGQILGGVMYLHSSSQVHKTEFIVNIAEVNY